MPRVYDLKSLKINAPAVYQIEVDGEVGENWSEMISDVRIVKRARQDNSTISTLVVRIRDQAELLGLLNSFYNYHLSILSVELLHDEEGNPKQ